MLLSLCYVLVRRALDLAMWCLCSNNRKELEIAVLRHELSILRRRAKRPSLTTVDRLFLAAASRLLVLGGILLRRSRVASCRGRIGDRSSSRRRRSYDGTVGWWRDGGRLPVQSVARRSAVRSEA